MQTILILRRVRKIYIRRVNLRYTTDSLNHICFFFEYHKTMCWIVYVRMCVDVSAFSPAYGLAGLISL